MIGPSAHLDTFSRDNLPEESLQPDFLLDNFNYPSFLNQAIIALTFAIKLLGLEAIP